MTDGVLIDLSPPPTPLSALLPVAGDTTGPGVRALTPITTDSVGSRFGVGDAWG